MIPEEIQNAWVIVYNITSDVKMLTFHELPTTLNMWQQNGVGQDLLDEMERAVSKLIDATNKMREVTEYFFKHEEKI